MNLLPAAKTLISGRMVLAGAATLAALALVNHAAARRAELRHPPRGRFIEVDGVRLHYTDRGAGRPVVLVHGNAVTGDDYDAMALRPSQIRATSVDGALMIPGALSLRQHYDELSMPVVIMAGEGDKVVFARRAKQLQACIPGSVLQIVKGAGHMVHHSVPRQVVEAIRQVMEASKDVSGGQTLPLRALTERPIVAA